LDAFLFGLPILVLAAWFNALVVFGIAFAVLLVINVASCNWVDRKWDAWVVGTPFRSEDAKVRAGERADARSSG
jgi:hypothetical protein